MTYWRTIQRFIYSHYFLAGVRQAVGVLTPAVVIVGLVQSYAIGLVASMGAICVAIVDQAGGGHQQARNTMLAAMVLSSVSAFVTGLVSAQTILIWVAVPLLTFSFSMLAVYGPRGGLLGVVSLLIMTLTMRAPLTFSEVLVHSLYLLGGGLFYFLYSLVVRYLFRAREARENLAAALFSMADYLRTRACLYDTKHNLDYAYRDLIRAQSTLVDALQTLNKETIADVSRFSNTRLQHNAACFSGELQRLLNNFVDTRTDFASLRNGVSNPAVLVAAHDTLVAMSDRMALLALYVARNKAVPLDLHATDVPLRVIQDQLQANVYVDDSRRVISNMQQVYERFSRAVAILNQMAAHTSDRVEQPRADADGTTSSGLIEHFMGKERWQFGLLLSSLRLSAPGFRHAIRVSVAVVMAMGLSLIMAKTFRSESLDTIGEHGYWVVLTVIVVMKPGFALTRQRNGWRLVGTLSGCTVAVGLFHMLGSHREAYLVVLFLFGILGYSLVQINYLLSALCNTVLVLTAFHLLSPASDVVVGARLVDTLFGCAIALLCSYILPTWEARFLVSLADGLKTANGKLLEAGVALIEAPGSRQAEARQAWDSARNNMYVAFSRFSESFYRMMGEPVSHQGNAAILNHFMVQNHTFAMQVMHVVASATKRPDDTLEVGPVLASVLRLLDKDEVSPGQIDLSSIGAGSDMLQALQQLVESGKAISRDMRNLG